MSVEEPRPVESLRARSGRWLRRGGRIGSSAFCLGLAWGYGVRPDWGAAVTVFPPWIWLVPGLGLLALKPRKHGGRADRAVVAAWAVYLVVMAEEPRSLTRGLVRSLPGPRRAEPAGEFLRVISLNCAAGTRLAAEEVIGYRPDVVCLQESPGRTDVEALGQRLFGPSAVVVHGVDASVVARGRLVPTEPSATGRGYFVSARVELASGRTVEVISTRLLPALFREDLWARDCWREQAENRRQRREQLRVIARRIEATPVPVILGGDFNAPQRDAVFALLQPRLRDTFTEAGIGWGNTILNEVPALRIDQVWVSPSFFARTVVARPTVHSDHRMVVCDLILRGDPDAAPRR